MCIPEALARVSCTADLDVKRGNLGGSPRLGTSKRGFWNLTGELIRDGEDGDGESEEVEQG